VAAFDGARLAAYRTERGWSQVELAERMQRARSGELTAAAAARQIRTLLVQISCYESGSTRPRVQAVRLLAQLLEVDVLDLLGAHTPVTLGVLRARLGLTQAQVARELGMSRSLYAFVEQGRHALTKAEATTLAGVLQVTPDRIRHALPQPVPRTQPGRR
jgi:transcriptional regulator with XRE-family HTH domain